MAYRNVQVTLGGNLISGLIDLGLGVGTLNIPSTINIPSISGYTLEFGTGAGKANLLAMKTYALAGAAQNVDLAALTDPGGAAINFARIKLLLLIHFGVTAGQFLAIGGAAANPWAAPFNATTDIKKLMPGFTDANGVLHPNYELFSAPDATGLVVSGTSKVLKLDPGAATFTVGLIAAGCDA